MVVQDVPFLRLLKKFDPSDFQSKPTTSKYNGRDNDGLMKSGKQGYITDQLLELPLEHCIYDMIDAEGPKGLTILEVVFIFYWLFVSRSYLRSAICLIYSACMFKDFTFSFYLFIFVELFELFRVSYFGLIMLLFTWMGYRPFTVSSLLSRCKFCLSSV